MSGRQRPLSARASMRREELALVVGFLDGSGGGMDSVRKHCRRKNFSRQDIHQSFFKRARLRSFLRRFQETIEPAWALM